MHLQQGLIQEKEDSGYEFKSLWRYRYFLTNEIKVAYDFTKVIHRQAATFKRITELKCSQLSPLGLDISFYSTTNFLDLIYQIPNAANIISP